jgi:hypothetical protein
MIVAQQLGAPEGIACSVVVIGLLAYVLPSAVAVWRHHPNAVAISALNLLLGWTVLGWVGALVWSLTRPAVRP